MGLDPSPPPLQLGLQKGKKLHIWHLNLSDVTLNNPPQKKKIIFQGQNIYSGCNKLQIQYSHLSDVTVNYNNDRSFDFTNPSLPPGELSLVCVFCVWKQILGRVTVDYEYAPFSGRFTNPFLSHGEVNAGMCVVCSEKNSRESCSFITLDESTTSDRLHRSIVTAIFFPYCCRMVQ